MDYVQIRGHKDITMLTAKKNKNCLVIMYITVIITVIVAMSYYCLSIYQHEKGISDNIETHNFAHLDDLKNYKAEENQACISIFFILGAGTAVILLSAAELYRILHKH